MNRHHICIFPYFRKYATPQTVHENCLKRKNQCIIAQLYHSHRYFVPAMCFIRIKYFLLGDDKIRNQSRSNWSFLWNCTAWVYGRALKYKIIAKDLGLFPQNPLQTARFLGEVVSWESLLYSEQCLLKTSRFCYRSQDYPVRPTLPRALSPLKMGLITNRIGRDILLNKGLTRRNVFLVDVDFIALPKTLFLSQIHYYNR